MSYDAEGAINVMLNGLNMDRPKSFQQADGLVSRNINRVPATLANIIGAKIIFELAWTLLSQRRYKESAEWFLKVTELNSWSVISSCRRHEQLTYLCYPIRSHGTYYYIAASCYLSTGDIEKAQKLFDEIPKLIESKKIAGKDLPTEVLIKKKSKLQGL